MDTINDAIDAIDPEIVNDITENNERILVIDDEPVGIVKRGRILPNIATILAATSQSMNLGDVFRGIGIKPKPYIEPKKCLNPNCEEITDHKRGYCSKDCLEEHKKITKGK